MKKLLFLCLALLYLGSSAYAGLVQPFGIGARNAALGEAVSAYAKDAFAVYYNPAGLSNIERPMLSTGLSIYDAEVYYKNFKITDAAGENITPGFIENTRWKGDMDPLLNPHLGFARRISDKLSFGIAAYAPYGFHLKTDKDPFKKPMGFNAWESMYTRTAVTPAIAWKIGDHLSIGFGLSLGRSNCEAGKTNLVDPFQKLAIDKIKEGLAAQLGAAAAEMVFADINPDRSESGGRLITTQLDMEDDFNWSWNAGVQYSPNEKLSLGLVYRSRADGDFKGDFIHDGQKVGTATMPYDHPDQVQLGIRYAFTEKFALSFDLVWAHWKINKFQHEYITSNTLPNGVVKLIDDVAENLTNLAVVTGKLPPNISPEEFKELNKTSLKAQMEEATLGKTLDMGYKRDWSNEIQYKVGLEYIFNNNFTLLASYVYDPTPVPKHSFDNGWPDNNRHLMNLGASVRLNSNWTIDLAVQHIRTFAWGYRDDINGESENLNNTIGKPLTGNNDARVHVENQGYLWGYALTANYSF